MKSTRQNPIGAELLPNGQGAHFRLWAPKHESVDVVFEESSQSFPLTREPDGYGYFSGTVDCARAGTLYRYRLNGERGPCLPDPASRFQPTGPHGDSMIVDPVAFEWTDADWRGASHLDQVIYELHVGTFTQEGTWRAAERELPALAELGVTALEIMPVTEFPGRFGWGYDGVCWFAPYHHYGSPDDFRHFVDAAHRSGLAVLLDCVYNHFGPDGCYLTEFSNAYLTTNHKSEWGNSPNFDGPDSRPVRQLVVTSATTWIREYHLDGLRLDATQAMIDGSTPHILQELDGAVQAAGVGGRVIVVVENEPQQAHLVRDVERGGYGLEMVWNDDWHHSAKCAATGQDEAYFTDTRGRPQEFVSAAKYGFLYAGQYYRWQAKRRGTPAFDLEPWQFVHFLENHDQLANSGFGDRLPRETSSARWRALTGLLLLGPQTPMLFQGQEYGSSKPWVYFADHHAGLAPLVQKGRLAFMAQFANLAVPGSVAKLPVPHDVKAFEGCKLDHSERERDLRCRMIWRMHRDLIQLRREDPTLRRAQRQRGSIDGAVIAEECFVLRFFGEKNDDRLLVVNLGRAVHFDPCPEPLLAPPGSPWKIIWSSQDVCYGGIGTLVLDAPEVDRTIPEREIPRPFENWRIQGEIAVLLGPSEQLA